MNETLSPTGIFSAGISEKIENKKQIQMRNREKDRYVHVMMSEEEKSEDNRKEYRKRKKKEQLKKKREK